MLGVNWRVGITSKILGGPAYLAENCLNSCMIEQESAILSPTSEPSTLGRLCERGDLGSTRSRSFLPKKYLKSDITEYLEKQQYTKEPPHNYCTTSSIVSSQLPKVPSAFSCLRDRHPNKETEGKHGPLVPP